MYGGHDDGSDGNGDGDSTSWWMRSDGCGCDFRGLSLSSSSQKGMVSLQFILGLTWRCQHQVVRSDGTGCRTYHCSLSFTWPGTRSCFLGDDSSLISSLIWP